MTLPPSLSDLDPDSDSDHELSRLTLVVGGFNVDIGLPADVRIGDYINDVIDIANDQIEVREPGSDIQFDDSAGKWTLARLGGEPIDPNRSLSDAGIYDGELLMISEVGRSISPLLFDDVDDTVTGEPSAVRAWLAADRATLTCFGVALAASSALAAVVPQWSGDRIVSTAVLALGALGVVLACALAFRSRARSLSAWVTAVALPLVFSGSLYVVPDGFGATSLPMAFASDGAELGCRVTDLGNGPCAAHERDRRIHVRRRQRDRNVAIAAPDPHGRGDHGNDGCDRGLPRAADDDRAVEAAHPAGPYRGRAARRHRNPRWHHRRGRQRDRQADHPHGSGTDPDGCDVRTSTSPGSW